MPRSKLNKTADNNDALSLQESVTRLSEQVEALAGHVQILHDVLDQIRDDLSWALKNDAFRSGERYVAHVTSVPIDPCRPDFGTRINRFSGKNLPKEAAEDAGPSDTTDDQSGSLF